MMPRKRIKTKVKRPLHKGKGEEAVPAKPNRNRSRARALN